MLLVTLMLCYICLPFCSTQHGHCAQKQTLVTNQLLSIGWIYVLCMRNLPIQFQWVGTNINCRFSYAKSKVRKMFGAMVSRRAKLLRRRVIRFLSYRKITFYLCIILVSRFGVVRGIHTPAQSIFNVRLSTFSRTEILSETN